MAIKEHAATVDPFPRRQGTTLNYGSVEGQLVELNEVEDNGADIVIEDRAFRARVTSHLPTELAEIAKEALGGRVLVEGRVLRDADRGRPIRVVEVTMFEQLGPIDDGMLLRVAGIWEAPAGYEIVTARAANFADPTEDA